VQLLFECLPGVSKKGLNFKEKREAPSEASLFLEGHTIQPFIPF
jgi:hypothetical protein